MFHGLRQNAVNLTGHHLRLAHRELKTFTAHLFNQDRQSQFTTPLNFPCIGTVRGKNAQAHVTYQLLVKAVLHLTCSHLGVLFTPSKWRRVDTDSHGDRRFIHRDRWHGTWVFQVGNGVTDHDVGNTCDSDDVTSRSFSRGEPFETLGFQKF